MLKTLKQFNNKQDSIKIIKQWPSRKYLSTGLARKSSYSAQILEQTSNVLNFNISPSSIYSAGILKSFLSWQLA
jgi:hypothetical protein